MKGDGMRGQLRLAATLLALAGAAGCGPRPGSRPAAAPPVRVEVINQNRSDVNLYVLRGGTRTRLGTVVAGNSSTFRLRHLPGTGVQQLGFEVQRIGVEGVYTLRSVAVGPGQAVHIRLEDLMSTSEVSVTEGPVVPVGKSMP
jgi:hypothetical protein